MPFRPPRVEDYFCGKVEALEALGDRDAVIENYLYALPLGIGRSLHVRAKAKLKTLTSSVGTPKD